MKNLQMLENNIRKWGLHSCWNVTSFWIFMQIYQSFLMLENSKINIFANASFSAVDNILSLEKCCP